MIALLVVWCLQMSVAASSTISGFDILSLSGAAERQCNRCSFLNGADDGVCGACGVALVANQCMDHQTVR
jgi:hypothetical protein